MVGAQILPLDLALFIVLGANIGTCVTALLASVGANANSKRVALIHFTFNVIGTALFTAVIWIFKEPMLNLLVSLFPGDDTMSLQMRLSAFHVIFNVTTTAMLLPFVKQLVDYSCLVIKDVPVDTKMHTLKFVDDRLLATPPIALMQVKKEMDYMFSLVEENMRLSRNVMENGTVAHTATIRSNEEIIDFTNGALTSFLIKLSAGVDPSDERTIGSYFHVLNDLERMGDHAENFYEIGEEMQRKELFFSPKAREDIRIMGERVTRMLVIAMDAFGTGSDADLPELSRLEDEVDRMKKELTASHFSRLAEGNCSMEVSPYYSSAVLGLERVADHLVNVGFSIVDPVGDQNGH
jgi:phosphate:Na+ symporter